MSLLHAPRAIGSTTRRAFQTQATNLLCRVSNLSSAESSSAVINRPEISSGRSPCCPTGCLSCTTNLSKSFGLSLASATSSSSSSSLDFQRRYFAANLSNSSTLKKPFSDSCVFIIHIRIFFLRDPLQKLSFFLLK